MKGKRTCLWKMGSPGLGALMQAEPGGKPLPLCPSGIGTQSFVLNVCTR